MEKPLVSIIVSAYNIHKYIDKCLNSIYDQNYKNIEVIIVDDGSTDGTGEVCDYYTDLDKRFRVIHQTNQGRVLARTRGIQEAVGDYIGIVDGDDWIEPELYEYLMDMALRYNSDMVTSGFIRDKNGSRSIAERPLEEKECSLPETLEYVLGSMLFDEDVPRLGMMRSMGTKIYKAQIIKSIIGKVPYQLKIGEDCLTNILYILESKSIYIGKQAYYHYRIHNESTMQRPCQDYLAQINILFIELKNIFCKLQIDDVLLKQLDRMIVHMTIDGLNSKIGLSNETYIPEYIFDVDGLEQKRIILYGAGAVGRDYYLQIQRHKSIQLVLWVDQGYERLKEENLNLSDVSMIINSKFDKILIACRFKKTAEEIMDSLYKKYAIQPEVVVWRKPKEIYVMDS